MPEVSDKLVKGIRIGGVVYRNFAVRTPLIEDAQEAEDVAPASAFYRHNAALLARCMVRMEEGSGQMRVFNGPFDRDMFGKLGRNDFAVMVTALNKADDLGNEQPSADPTS